MPTGDLVITTDMLEDYTQVPNNPHHRDPLPLIDYMTVMGARCTEQDRGLKASTMFRNIHCVGRWIQHNIQGIDHTTSFNRPVLQIIHISWLGNTPFVLTRPSFTVSSQTPRAHAVPNTHTQFWSLVCVRTSYQMMSLTITIGCLCNAPIQRVRGRYCDVYTQVRNTLTYIR